MNVSQVSSIAIRYLEIKGGRTSSNCTDRRPGSCLNKGKRMDDGHEQVDLTLQAEVTEIKAQIRIEPRT